MSSDGISIVKLYWRCQILNFISKQTICWRCQIFFNSFKFVADNNNLIGYVWPVTHPTIAHKIHECPFSNESIAMFMSDILNLQTNVQITRFAIINMVPIWRWFLLSLNLILIQSYVLSKYSLRIDILWSVLTI